MELNRRGFFFSLISLLLLIGLFFISQPRPYETTLVQERASQDRIVFTNAIINNFERGYLARAVESQTYVVFEALTEHRNDNGSLYASRSELEADFAEGLVNGTFDNGARTVDSYLSGGELDAAQRDLLELLELYANASGQNYNIQFNFSDDPNDYVVTLFQDEVTGPWQVGVELELAYNVSPGSLVYGDEIANWTLNRTITSYASIRDVRDPYLYVRSGGRINSSVREFYTERWSRPVFETFVSEGTYVSYNKSMSLLGRYYDSLEYSTCCGMLTTINETKYAAYHGHLGSGFKNVTFLDCGYFPGSAVTAVCRRDADRLVYAVRDLSDYRGPVDGQIVDNTSAFPFTIGGKIGVEFFNMTIGVDLIDVYEAIS